MGTINARKRKDGSIGYTAQILKKQKDMIVHREAKTFDRKQAADAWMKRRETELSEPGALEKAKTPDATLTTAIDRYSTDAIGASFTRACKVFGIEGLRFHDLRHDGVSRLFEMGKTIPQAASVSGHRSWQSLQRYTHLRQTGDKYADWKWLLLLTGKLAR